MADRFGGIRTLTPKREVYDRFLEAHPEYKNRVNFIAVTQPSRMDVEEYRDYLDDMSATVGRINAKYANVETGWQPIQIIMGESYPRVLAAMRWYDVLLVNPVRDGLNLVAKEGPVLNTCNGVLALSREAGAWDELGSVALEVNPFDVSGTADVLATAYAPPALQAVKRDFAFLLPLETPADQLLRAVRGADKNAIVSVSLFDVFTGQGVPEGEKSLAVEVTLQPTEKSFTEAELKAISERIVAAAAKLGARLRD